MFRIALVVLALCACSSLPARAQGASSSIRGRVFAGNTGQPIRGARVSVSGLELGGVRQATTDAEGRFEVTRLPAGTFTVTATRGGYLTIRYGQRWPRDAAMTVTLRERDSAGNIDITLPLMSVITGRITDESGAPVEGVTVLALRRRFWEGRRQLVPSGQATVQTDASGRYRILGLAPGSYYVMALMRRTRVVERGGESVAMGFAPTYFPGTQQASDAGMVAVGAGVDAPFVDFALEPGRTATLSGTAVDANGRAFDSVTLREQIRGEDFSQFSDVKAAPVAADGSFRLRDVPPGEYQLRAVAHADTPRPHLVTAPIVVNGENIDGVTLTGSEGGTIDGRIEIESSGPFSLPVMRLSAGLPFDDQPDAGRESVLRSFGWSDVTEDGAFAIKGVFGPTRLRVALPGEWAVTRIVYNDRDITRTEFELGSGETMGGVRVFISNQVSSVTGRLADARGVGVSDATVVLFAADARLWVSEPRTVQAVRPDPRGNYRVPGLPAGEYLAVAVRYVEDGVWQDPGFLESLRSSAQKLTVTRGNVHTVALRLVTPPAGP